MEITHDLRHRLLDAEKFVSEEIVDLDRFVFVEALDMGVGTFLNVANSGFDDNIIKTRMGQLGDGGIFLDLVEVTKQLTPPRPGLIVDPVFPDDALELGIIIHSNGLP